VTKSPSLLSMLSALALVAACGSPPPPATPDAPPPASAAPAASPSAAPATSAAPAAAPSAAPAAAAQAPVEATIEPRSKSKLKGTATFTPVDGGVKVTIQVSGAPPGKIATHVHETGDCSAPDAKSAGSHFNPDTKAHGMPDAAAHHLGDLGNIDVKPDGTGALEITVKGANLIPGDPHSYLGRALIVHEKVDDGGQPVGNAGARFGCAVIGPKK